MVFFEDEDGVGFEGCGRLLGGGGESCGEDREGDDPEVHERNLQ